MNQLSKKELLDVRESLRKLVWQIHERKFELLDEGKITADEFKKISRREQKIKDFIDQITLIVFNSIITDIQQPGEKIVLATNNVNNAIKKLEEINKFLEALESAINLFTTITLAVSTGNPAQIASIFDQIAQF